MGKDLSSCPDWILDAKSSCWSFIVYPENYDSMSQLTSMLSDDMWLDYSLSPIHRPDEDKKPHCHLLLMFPNAVHFSSMRRIGERINSSKKIIIPINRSQAMRYHIHLDDPQKEQFPEGKSLILVHGLLSQKLFINSFSDNELTRVSASLRSIHNYVVDNDINDVLLLQQYLLGVDYSSYMLVNQNYNYFKALCQSRNKRFNINDKIDFDE